jgi:hypothetical protein
VDENRVSDIASKLLENDVGREIEIHSIKTLLNTYDIKEAVLKMDCEGCEYNLLNEEVEVLKRFKRIQIEYHYGYRRLCDYLKNDFDLKHTKPQKGSNNMKQGYIFAKRKTQISDGE